MFKGARWYKCDFHLHTPASECFVDKKISPEDIIQHAVDKKLDCIAVTDHNNFTFIDAIKLAAKDSPITVFPGVEITCSESKIHLLVLFDTEKAGGYIRDFLSACDVPSFENNNVAELYTSKSIFDVCDIADKRGGIVIPAHADNYTSIAQLSDQNLKQLLDKGNILAIQITNAYLSANLHELDFGDFEKYQKHGKMLMENEVQFRERLKVLKYAKEKQICGLTFSDNPAAEGSNDHGVWGIGKDFSWIKMGETPTLEGLRQALLVGDLRIKNSFNFPEDVRKYPDLWFKNLKITSSKIQDNEISVPFNPNFNAIIGGRGSGKSSIQRFLRGVLNKRGNLKREVFKDIRSDFEKYYSLKDGIILPDTQIELDVIYKSVHYRICASEIRNPDSQKITISVLDKAEGKFVIQEEQAILEAFDATIYSQKQIYEMSKDENSLREIIDGFSRDVEELQLEINKSYDEYFSLCSTRRQLKKKYDEKKLHEAELDIIQKKIENMAKSGIQDLFTRRDLFDNQNRYVSFSIGELDNLLQEMEGIVWDNFKFPYEEPEFLSEHQKEMQEFITRNENELRGLKNDHTDLVDKIRKTKNEMMKNKECTQWNLDYLKLKNEIVEKTENDNTLPDDFKKTYKDKSDLEVKIRGYLEIENTFTEIQKSISEKESFIIKKIENRYHLRRDFVDSVLIDTNVRVKINHMRDAVNFEGKFRDLLSLGESFPGDVKSFLDGTWFTQGKAIDNREKYVQQLEKIRTGETTNIYDARFRKKIIDIEPSVFDQLIMLMPEDQLSVSYKTNDHSEFKKIDDGSAGQRTAAILTFILAFGRGPLFLDQPEDDLDNKLVYNLIVDSLRKVKHERQVIVITHNPNIPVNGDAELVIVMDSGSKKINVGVDGCIDELNVKNEICEVMEGGEIAFNLRAKRYGRL